MRPPPNFTSKALDRQAWDEAQARRLVGLYVLVGVTWTEADGETLLDQAQYHGRIVSAAPEGITIACEGRWAGQTLTLPPDPSRFDRGQRARYTLRATGEVVVDPDLVASWQIRTGGS